MTYRYLLVCRFLVMLPTDFFFVDGKLLLFIIDISSFKMLTVASCVYLWRIAIAIVCVRICNSLVICFISANFGGKFLPFKSNIPILL